MDLFNVTARVTLDTSGYDKGIDTVKTKTTSTVGNLKAQFKDMTEANKRAMASLVNDFKSGAISFDEYHKKVSEIRGNQKALEQEMGELGISTEKFGAMAVAKFALIATAVVTVTQKIKALTLDLIGYADRYGDLSAKYDISTQSLQEFEYIASQNGTTLEELLSTMTMMQNRAKENADVFGKLGVSVTDTNGNMKSMDTLFWEVKTALDNVQNSGDKSALMLEAFGRNAMSVGEVLRTDTTELQALAQQAYDLGIVLDTKTIESSGKFNDKLDELKLRAKSAFAELIFGAEGAEEKFDKLVDELIVVVDKLLPNIEEAGKRIGMALIRGLLKAFKTKLKDMVSNSWGWMIGKGWLWGKGSLFGIGDNSDSQEVQPITDTDVVDMNNYEITERSSQVIELKLTASGTTPIDQANAEMIAKTLTPYLDKTLGGV